MRVSMSNDHEKREVEKHSFYVDMIFFLGFR